MSSCNRTVSELSETYVNPLRNYKFSCQLIDSTDVRAALPALEKEFGSFVDCPDVYRPKLLAALSFYPELKGIRITIVQKPLKTSMAARPANYAFARNKRRYNIYVDDITDKVTDFRRYPYSAQIGCFVHELGHVAYYEQRSNARLTYDGLSYVSRQKYRSHYEELADHNSLSHGGGYYGYMYRNYTLNEAGISKKYRLFKRANYYTGKKLLELHNEQRTERGLSPCQPPLADSAKVFRPTLPIK
ncbi:hypothetical protein [Neolewinella antarctica]|uniref:Uncharacterized protein n=1 Tax=Neolewinella antarctica TaxID=442734 RepID=A0ABX0XBJ9_9BACT|nr:hypothetical protein [Neolewinella antarctica]NJC26314.1 hypothetical protein [Neolewinella antarctica]